MRGCQIVDLYIFSLKKKLDWVFQSSFESVFCLQRLLNWSINNFHCRHLLIWSINKNVDVHVILSVIDNEVILCVQGLKFFTKVQDQALTCFGHVPL